MALRLRAALLVVVFALSGLAAAECPPDCVAGGGPAATDCFVAFGGISSTSVSCTDGTSCDMDGQVNGTCMIGVQACINVPGLGSCAPAGLSGPPTVTPASNPTAQALASALQSLDPTVLGCTTSGIPLALPVSLKGIKPGKAKLKVTASAGKRDVDKLKLTCLPSTTAISYAQQVEPIVTQRCAIPTCHDRFSGAASGNQVLEAGAGFANTVGVPATLGNRLRVKAGSIKGSEMARRILGKGMAPGGTPMPQGCGVLAGVVCLTDAEKFTILAWIATGAQP